MALSLITLSNLADAAAQQANAAKLLERYAPDASAQHLKNFRTVQQQIAEALSANQSEGTSHE